MKIIGITGPTGAGKTTALHVLEELGACVLDADAIYHELLENDDALRYLLEERFGPLAREDGSIDRKKLGEMVFNDPAALADLNDIAHGAVLAALLPKLAQARAAGVPVAAIDAIALIESGLAAECDAVVAVLAPLEVRLGRIMARDGIDADYARRRALAQKGEDFFRAHAHYVLENGPEDSAGEFEARARSLLERILA